MAGPLFYDRVKETSTSNGTGTITLAGAASGFRSFGVVGDGNSCCYCIVDVTDWEVGVGTYTLSGTTLSRDTILASSNAGAAVVFGTNAKDVFLTSPAQSGPRMVTTKEIIFAGRATTTITNGTDYTVDGIAHRFSGTGAPTCAIVADGLSLTGVASYEAFCGAAAGYLKIALGDGDVAQARWAKGGVAMWFRLFSVTLNANGNYVYIGINGGYPKHGANIFRSRGQLGTQNTSIGGVAASTWWNGTDAGVKLVDGNTYDTFCVYFDNPTSVKFYLGTWSSGWPAFGAMKLAGSAVLGGYSAAPLPAWASGMSGNAASGLENFAIQICVGPSSAMVLDRYRFTVWE